MEGTEKKKTVLVVDDEPLNLRLLGRLLGGAYQVLLASGADEALEELAKGGIDLVLTDLEMPVPHPRGFEVYQAAQQAGIPALLMSGLDTDRVRDKLPQGLSGRLRLITKPYEGAVLLARVARLLAGQEDPFDY